jgi:drug/metabolite transporter (DMT)-like permease
VNDTVDRPWHLLIPLTSAMIYVVGAMLLKRSAGLGVGVWRTAFISNLIAALVFQPLLLLGGNWQPLAEYWQPALVGLLFLAGQLLTILSLSKGDVSVATPVLGVKIILVAIFVTVVLGQPPKGTLWLAAGLSMAAIALLNFSQGARHHHVGVTVLSAGGAAASFALFDVLVQKWGPAWGPGRFLPVMLWFVALYAFAFVPMFSHPLREIPRGAWPWLLGGSGFVALQSVLFVWYLARHGNATAANVVYSSRGLWSVVAVWLVGHWFHNLEREQGGSVMRWRLAGAILMMLAIGLVLL